MGDPRFSDGDALGQQSGLGKRRTNKRDWKTVLLDQDLGAFLDVCQYGMNAAGEFRSRAVSVGSQSGDGALPIMRSNR